MQKIEGTTTQNLFLESTQLSLVIYFYKCQILNYPLITPASSTASLQTKFKELANITDFVFFFVVMFAE